MEHCSAALVEYRQPTLEVSWASGRTSDIFLLECLDCSDSSHTAGHMGSLWSRFTMQDVFQTWNQQYICTGSTSGGQSYFGHELFFGTLKWSRHFEISYIFLRQILWSQSLNFAVEATSDFERETLPAPRCNRWVPLHLRRSLVGMWRQVMENTVGNGFRNASCAVLCLFAWSTMLLLLVCIGVPVAFDPIPPFCRTWRYRSLTVFFLVVSEVAVGIWLSAHYLSSLETTFRETLDEHARGVQYIKWLTGVAWWIAWIAVVFESAFESACCCCADDLKRYWSVCHVHSVYCIQPHWLCEIFQSAFGWYACDLQLHGNYGILTLLVAVTRWLPVCLLTVFWSCHTFGNVLSTCLICTHTPPQPDCSPHVERAVVCVSESFLCHPFDKGCFGRRACGLCLQQCSVSLAESSFSFHFDFWWLWCPRFVLVVELRAQLDKAKQLFKLFKSIICLVFHLGCLPR
jgi:hypothetical protein